MGGGRFLLPLAKPPCLTLLGNAASMDSMLCLCTSSDHVPAGRLQAFEGLCGEIQPAHAENMQSMLQSMQVNGGRSEPSRCNTSTVDMAEPFFSMCPEVPSAG